MKFPYFWWTKNVDDNDNSTEVYGRHYGNYNQTNFVTTIDNSRYLELGMWFQHVYLYPNKQTKTKSEFNSCSVVENLWCNMFCIGQIALGHQIT